MLGRHISSALRLQGYTVFDHYRSISDLRDYKSTKLIFAGVKPDLVIHCAALVGGIKANIEGGASLYQVNRQIDSNVFKISSEMRVEKLAYIGSSCIYPMNRSRLLRVEDLGQGELEPSNKNYALAKIEGINQVKNITTNLGLEWKTYVASNLYGPFDNFNPNKSHLIPAIIRKVMSAHKQGLKSVEMWGDGSPRREFTYVPEFASWLVSSIAKMNEIPEVLNVGLGEDFSVREYYEMVINLIDPSIRIIKNETMPNGIPSKLMDSSVANSLGWKPKVKPFEGIKLTLEWLEKEIGLLWN